MIKYQTVFLETSFKVHAEIVICFIFMEEINIFIFFNKFSPMVCTYKAFSFKNLGKIFVLLLEVRTVLTF